ncbi:hyaluronidase-1-like [Ylistrum balloti]|uniref:hyaluronidase-1-like n=1 Tax=Ylistrum balloti TaxID=509963 RepID=UPI002905959D|nr:hyaluronidase-1-like [Ylistrum balloti]
MDVYHLTNVPRAELVCKVQGQGVLKTLPISDGLDEGETVPICLEPEENVLLLMNQTLWKAKGIRGNGKWGYYGFPRCYNYRLGQDQCANDTIQYNNELSWLFNASSALFPSIYLDKDLFPTIEDRALRVQGIIKESLRVRESLLCRNCKPIRMKSIYAYTRYRYRQEDFYITPDLENTIGQSFDAGLDGVVVWDSSSNLKNKSDCLSLKDYLEQTLGPYINTITSFASQCHTKWCNRHGHCVRTTWPTKQNRTTDFQVGSDLQTRREFSMYRCVCSQPWTGQHCDQQT